MRRRSLISVSLALSIAVLAGCGTPDRHVATAGAPAPPAPAGVTETTPTSLGVRERAPDPVLPTIAAPENRNRKESALGRLCWERREIVLAFVDLLSNTVTPEGRVPDEEKAFRAIRRLKENMNAIAAEPASDPSELKAEVAAFRRQLIRAAAQVKPVLASLPDRADQGRRKETLKSLTNLLDFERFPGAKEFVASAQSHPDCPDL